MIMSLKIVIEKKSEKDLIEFLDFKNSFYIDSSQFDMIELALTSRWHSQHEDLVNTIYLEELKDDRFVDPIFEIALNRRIFRPYDDELESTLRKCVHALKIIDSEKSNAALKKLEELNNDNVRIILDMYK